MHPAAAAIRRLCKEKNVTFAWLSKETGISQPAMGRWFRGEVTPKLESRMLVARALGVPLADLLVEGESATEDATWKVSESVIERYLESEEGRELTEEEQRHLRQSVSLLPGSRPLARSEVRAMADLIKLRLRSPDAFAKQVLNPKGTPTTPRKKVRR
jgi:transcriptional regulator with XRE-family HTH domain